MGGNDHGWGCKELTQRRLDWSPGYLGERGWLQVWSASKASKRSIHIYGQSQRLMFMAFGLPLPPIAGGRSGCRGRPSLVLEISIAVLAAPDKICQVDSVSTHSCQRKGTLPPASRVQGLPLSWYSCL